MRPYTSFEIIDKIIGHISSVGETNYDAESLENLDEIYREFLFTKFTGFL